MNTQTAVNISMELQENKNELSLHEINTIAVTADNVAALQLAITDLVNRNPPFVAGLRCGAHVFNLVIRKSVQRFVPLQNAYTIPLNRLEKKR